MNATMTADKILTVRCRPFTGSPIGNHKVRVDADGTVRVYDSVAAHYTTCHILSEATQRRIRNLAS